MAAKLRHIAMSVPDPEKASRFYQDVFGMKEVSKTDSPLASGVYLSDGTVCLALLKYKSDEMSQGKGKSYVGVHHVGFWVDDLEAQTERISRHGGTFYMDLPGGRDSLYYERKFQDPDGIVFDVSHNGWVGAKKD